MAAQRCETLHRVTSISSGPRLPDTLAERAGPLMGRRPGYFHQCLSDGLAEIDFGAGKSLPRDGKFMDYEVAAP
jgi:hypothetical protein